MKTLLLVRHAKSSWDKPGLSDLERPLNERGKKDAPEMAKRLKERNIIPDLFLSSPAKRARKTARIFAEELGADKEQVRNNEELYMATPGGFTGAVESLDDQCNVAALFSHNPGITEYASTLTNVRVDDMPTCAVFAVQAETERWSDFGSAPKKFLFFDYPKNPLP